MDMYVHISMTTVSGFPFACGQFSIALSRTVTLTTKYFNKIFDILSAVKQIIYKLSK